MSIIPPEERLREVLSLLSGGHVPPGLAADMARDALNVVFGAMNSMAGSLVMTDLTGTICLVSTPFCGMFKYERSEIIGTNASELFAGRAISNFPDLAVRVARSKGATRECVAKRSDGQRFNVEMACSAITGNKGDVLGSVVSFIDITRRTKAEAELVKLTAQLEELRSQKDRVRRSRRVAACAE